MGCSIRSSLGRGCSEMEAGKLRHRVTIQQLVAGSPQQLPNGEPDVTWTDYLTVWAFVEPLKGRELMLAQQMQSEVDVRIRMRYRSGVTAAMRAVYASVNYDILAVIDPDLRRVELELLCKVGTNDG